MELNPMRTYKQIHFKVSRESISIGNNLPGPGAEQFKFGKTWTAELSGVYVQKDQGAIYIADRGQNAGIGKQVLEFKGTSARAYAICSPEGFQGYSKYVNSRRQFPQRDRQQGRISSRSRTGQQGQLKATQQPPAQQPAGRTETRVKTATKTGLSGCQYTIGA